MERDRLAVAPRSVAWKAVGCGGPPRSGRPGVRAAARSESDILIENFRPGRLEGWNLDPETLIAANPRLIVVRISGYGQTGPMHDQPAFGTIAEAAGGLRYITGEPDRAPGRVGLSLGDSIASLHAVIGALIALHERASSGRGQVVDVALTEALFSMLEGILPEYSYFGAVRKRTGNIAHNSAPTNAYPCAGRGVRLHRRELDRPVPDPVPGHRARRPRHRSGARDERGKGRTRGRAGRRDRGVDRDKNAGRRGRHAPRAARPGEPHQQHRRDRRGPAVPRAGDGGGGHGRAPRAAAPRPGGRSEAVPHARPRSALAQPLGAATEAVRRRVAHRGAARDRSAGSNSPD